MSNDFFLGDPFNIASAAAILSFMAKLTGYTPGVFVHHMNDVHFYSDHVDLVKEMLSRDERPLPKLEVTIPDLVMTPIGKETKTVAVASLFDGLLNQRGFNQVIDALALDNFKLTGYDPHPAIKAQMAV